MIFRCPTCTSPLARAGSRCVCERGHSFDVAREGYVNLLLRRSGDDLGDSGEMIRARHAFLERGYYETLAAAVLDLVSEVPGRVRVFDAGCGEGYYLRRLAGLPAERFGIDVAKRAIRLAARRDPEGFYAVADVHSLPVLDSSVAVLLSIFAHRAYDEFARVLEPDGRVIVVGPGPDHLDGLRKLMYGNGVPHEPKDALYRHQGRLEVRSERRLRYEIEVVRPEDVRALFGMTPYWWHAAPAARQAIERLERLRTAVDFVITVLGVT